MKNPLCILAALLLSAPFLSLHAAGDRSERMEIVFPEGAFRENGGPVIDITRPPFNAKGDGVTDDTRAFIDALNFLRDELAEARRRAHHPYAGRHSWTLYLPSGTYLVSDTLVHDGELRHGFCFLRLVGQDRENTVIRLRDNSPGFGPGQEKAVLPWTKLPAQGNIMWGNQARNFTIDTGSGNPGAVGMTFMGANACSLDNITIRSGDGRGFIGLDFPWWSVQGHFTDITVEGFDHSIRFTDSREIQPVLEHLTLRNPRVSGIAVQAPAAVSIRKLDFTGDVPAVHVTGEGTHLVMIESRIRGVSEGLEAINVENAGDNHTFLRDIEVENFVVSLLESEREILEGNIEEYVSGEVIAWRATPPRSLRLPAEDAPLVPWESNPEQWASPEHFEGSEAERIQAALDSGKPAVYFPKSYREGGRFTIPATVRQIDFLHLDEVRGAFVVNEASEEPLWIEHSQRRLPIVIRARRDVHQRFGSSRTRVETEEPVILHFQNLAVLTGGHEDAFCPPNVRIYARSINDEDRNRPNYVVNGGLLWVLGYKTEAHRESFMVKNGGLLEVLGGYRNHAGTGDQGIPLLHNRDGHVSLVATTYMARAYREAVWDDTSDTPGRWRRDVFPVRRSGHGGNYFIPLFVSFDPAAVAAHLERFQQLRDGTHAN
ncbi:MAG: hypothetical protein JJU05_09840 [Verrucomicrobia bacterium]|nr:hypothetical protein [Verrucomicrobiota bacterium]MCH8527550.1 glycoside hydrolase family 55 protein [Kiritimatiellia bacterium]